MNVTIIELEFVELPHVPAEEPAGLNNGYLLSMWDCTCRMARWNTAAQRFEDAGGPLNPRAIRSWSLMPKPLDFPTWGNPIVQAATAGSTEYAGAGWLEPTYVAEESEPELPDASNSVRRDREPEYHSDHQPLRGAAVALLNVSVIPAEPGYELIYMMDEGPKVLGPVLAWRISTYKAEYGGADDIRSEVQPLEVMGEPGSNFVGVKHPDGAVTIYPDADYPSWEAYCDDVKKQQLAPSATPAD
jgi:hypothetical protein